MTQKPGVKQWRVRESVCVRAHTHHQRTRGTGHVIIVFACVCVCTCVCVCQEPGVQRLSRLILSFVKDAAMAYFRERAIDKDQFKVCIVAVLCLFLSPSLPPHIGPSIARSLPPLCLAFFRHHPPTASLAPCLPLARVDSCNRSRRTWRRKQRRRF